MPANTNPIFALTPNCATAKITAATTDKTGATITNIKTLYTAGANGGKVTQIGFKAEGTSVAGLLLIWITDTLGNNPMLFDEIPVTAITTSNTVATNRVFSAYNDLQLAAGQQIKVGVTTISGNIIAFAQTGDF